jgi:hypothetical protein
VTDSLSSLLAAIWKNKSATHPFLHCFSLALPVSSVSGESGGAFLHAKMRCPLNTAKAYQYPSSKPFPGPVCDQIFDPIRDQTCKRFRDPFYETICGRSHEPFHGPFSVPFGQNRQIPGSLQKNVRRESQKLNRQYPPRNYSYLHFCRCCICRSSYRTKPLIPVVSTVLL